MAKGYLVETRISKNGTKSFRAKVRYKNTVCSETFKTKGSADKYGRETCISIDEGSYRNVAINVDYRNLKLGEALQEYIEDHPIGTEKQRKRKDDYVNGNSTISRYKISKLTLSEIDTAHLLAFIRERRQEGTADNTIRNNLSFISRIYTYGNSQWKLDLPNPTSLLDKTVKPKKAKPRERRLKDGEYEMLFEETKNSDAKYLHYLFRFACNSGLRLGETARITPNENAVRSKLVYLHGTKTDDDRMVPLTQGAYDALIEFKEDWGWGEETIFTYKEKTLSKRWYEFKQKLMDEGKLKENLTMHDLRHESLSRLFEIKNDAGHNVIPLQHVLQISGHKDVKTLMETYVKLDPADTVTLLEAVGA